MSERPRIDQPVAGFYAARLAKGALPVAIEIYYGQPIIDGVLQDRSPRWCCTVDGESARDEHDDDGNFIGRVPIDPIFDFDIWTRCCGNPVSAKEFDFLLKRSRWAREHDPTHPAANPRSRIDRRSMRPIF
jgi:hypothetical protein